MLYKVILLKKSKQDILNAKNWYKIQKNGLEKLFALDIKLKLNLIAKMPTAYPIKSEDVRYAKTKKFPYYIYFSINEGKKSIFIISILHNKRLENL